MDRSISFGRSRWTDRNDDREFPEWHLGRPWYYFWSVMIEDANWESNLVAARDGLSSYLVQGYLRQAHITLLPAGFPGANKIDVSQAMDIARLSSCFEISLASLTSFSSSPCFALDHGGEALRALRRQLRRVMFDPNSVVSDADYQPHLTVGLYRDRFDVAEISDRIAAVGLKASRPVQVTEFVLARYHTSSIKGSIQVVAKFALASGRFTQVQESEVIA